MSSVTKCCNTAKFTFPIFGVNPVCYPPAWGRQFWYCQTIRKFLRIFFCQRGLILLQKNSQIKRILFRTWRIILKIANLLLRFSSKPALQCLINFTHLVNDKLYNVYSVLFSLEINVLTLHASFNQRNCNQLFNNQLSAVFLLLAKFRIRVCISDMIFGQRLVFLNIGKAKYL